MADARIRCPWAQGLDPLYLSYHDDEWGVPSHDDRHLFEMLVLEGAQAGLSWATILRKRENYRRAFARFEAAAVARLIQREVGTFDAYVWQFVDGRPIVNQWRSLQQIPSETSESRAMSMDLKARGFRFVGPTVCYAFMQAVGMVNDHTIDCFRYRQLSPGKP